MATVLSYGFYYAWLPDVVGAQRDHADKLLGTAEATFTTQHPVAKIAKSLLQVTTCRVIMENM